MVFRRVTASTTKSSWGATGHLCFVNVDEIFANVFCFSLVFVQTIDYVIRATLTARFNYITCTRERTRNSYDLVSNRDVRFTEWKKRKNCSRNWPILVLLFLKKKKKKECSTNEGHCARFDTELFRVGCCNGNDRIFWSLFGVHYGNEGNIFRIKKKPIDNAIYSNWNSFVVKCFNPRFKV